MKEQELRELDIYCAEKVMGWRLIHAETRRPAKSKDDYDHAMLNDGWTFDDENEAWAWQPTKNKKQAMEVLEKCIEKLSGTRFQITICHTKEDGYIVTTDSSPDYDDMVHVNNVAASESLPLSIVLFAKHLFSKTGEGR